MRPCTPQTKGGSTADEHWTTAPQATLIGALIGAASTFGLGFVLDHLLKRLGQDRPRRVSYVLLGTIKNTSLAAATALALFNERTAVPAAAVSAVNVLYMVWLGKERV